MTELTLKLTQFRPGSRLRRLSLSSAPRRGGGGGPNLTIGKQVGGTYIYSLLYTHTGLLRRLLHEVLQLCLWWRNW
jgi:hypothetical protein